MRRREERIAKMRRSLERQGLSPAEIDERIKRRMAAEDARARRQGTRGGQVARRAGESARYAAGMYEPAPANETPEEKAQRKEREEKEIREAAKKARDKYLESRPDSPRAAQKAANEEYWIRRERERRQRLQERGAADSRASNPAPGANSPAAGERQLHESGAGQKPGSKQVQENQKE